MRRRLTSGCVVGALEACARSSQPARLMRLSLSLCRVLCRSGRLDVKRERARTRDLIRRGSRREPDGSSELAGAPVQVIGYRFQVHVSRAEMDDLVL